MQIMAGLDKPTNGEIWFADKNVTGVAVQKKKCFHGLSTIYKLPKFLGI